ncbi:PAS domain-containing protein [Methylorubrum extorquens]|uniref:PAS domain-containing protein n=1 Tax=Methylorubrum extorquens TaxID=408 RepID=UPI003F608957
MIWVTDHRGHVTYICRQWQVMTGQEPSAALKMGWVNAIYPDDKSLVVEGFAEACRRQVEFMLRFRLQRTDGTHVWVLGGSSPTFTPLTHDFVGFLGVLSQYEDEVQNLTADAEIGTFKPGRPTGEFAPLSKLDIAADHLIAARAITLGYGDEVAAAIDHALHALSQALGSERSRTGSLDTSH